MVSEILIDASEVEQLGRAIANLPGQIKAKAMARAMRRMRDRARTEAVNYMTKRLSVPRGLVSKTTVAHFNAGGNTIEVVEKSGWIPIYALGARQTRAGVSTRLRGSYRSAFIAKMSNGHTGVMKRVGSSRLPIRELFGPNPAHDITNSPDEYLELLAGMIERELAPRVLHELGRLLPG